MNPQIVIRPETTHDHNRVEEILIAAFRDHHYSDQNEHLLLNRLREEGALVTTLIAEQAGLAVGHIAFSKVLVDDEDLNWYGLAPLAVHPDFHLQGIGTELVNAGLKEIQNLGAQGCVVFGDPNYYGRFGFQTDTGLVYPPAPPEYFMALSFAKPRPKGVIKYHQAFSEFE